MDVESWPEGQQALTPIKDALLELRTTIVQQPPPVIPPATTLPSVQRQATASVQPGMQTWGSVQGQPPAPTQPPAATPNF